MVIECSFALVCLLGLLVVCFEGWGKTCAFEFTTLQCTYQLPHSHLQDDLANVDSYASQLGWYNLFKPKGKGNKYLGLDALVGVRFLPHTHTPFRFEFWWYVSSM